MKYVLLDILKRFGVMLVLIIGAVVAVTIVVFLLHGVIFLTAKASIS